MCAGPIRPPNRRASARSRLFAPAQPPQAPTPQAAVAMRLRSEPWLGASTSQSSSGRARAQGRACNAAPCSPTRQSGRAARCSTRARTRAARAWRATHSKGRNRLPANCAAPRRCPHRGSAGSRRRMDRPACTASHEGACTLPLPAPQAAEARRQSRRLATAPLADPATALADAQTRPCTATAERLPRLATASHRDLQPKGSVVRPLNARLARAAEVEAHVAVVAEVAPTPVAAQQRTPVERVE
eukprot:1101814-Pleurochrysis_carterae.AAC.1